MARRHPPCSHSPHIPLHLRLASLSFPADWSSHQAKPRPSLALLRPPMTLPSMPWFPSWKGRILSSHHPVFTLPTPSQPAPTPVSVHIFPVPGPALGHRSHCQACRMLVSDTCGQPRLCPVAVPQQATWAKPFAWPLPLSLASCCS